jgi:hypothetical protein
MQLEQIPSPYSYWLTAPAPASDITPSCDAQGCLSCGACALKEGGRARLLMLSRQIRKAVPFRVHSYFVSCLRTRHNGPGGRLAQRQSVHHCHEPLH